MQRSHSVVGASSTRQGGDPAALTARCIVGRMQ